MTAQWGTTVMAGPVPCMCTNYPHSMDSKVRKLTCGSLWNIIPVHKVTNSFHTRMNLGQGEYGHRSVQSSTSKTCGIDSVFVV